MQVELFRVDPKPAFTTAAKRAVSQRISEANQVSDYEPETADLDGSLLEASANEPNWSVIQGDLLNEQATHAWEFDQLKDVDLMVMEFRLPDGDERLLVAKRLAEKLTRAKLAKRMLVFDAGTIDLMTDSKKLFSLSIGVDFFVFMGKILIANKVEYERALNIREGMIRKRDSLFNQLRTSNKFDGIEHLETAVSDKAPMLRRASKALDAQYIESEEFLEALFALVAENPDWRIIVRDGKIEITPENSDDVLYLLSDARARTLIQQRLIDISVGKPVGGN